MNKEPKKRVTRVVTKRQISYGLTEVLDRYFATLDGELPTALYEMVITSAERELFAYVLTRAGGNKTVAAKMLGVSRTTLRAKLETYHLLQEKE